MPPPSPLRPIARRALAAQSDERLVRLVREGHEPAFEEMVRRYRGALVAFATAIVSADRAEDVVQASLEKANRALLADAREIALRPWLFAIVRNGALNAIRGEPRVDELGEAMAIAAGPAEIAEQREDLDRLVLAICALPEAQRDALVKRELEGVGHGEIAAQLGTTATAVRGLIFRARTGLRDALGAAVPLPVLRSLLTEGAAAGAGVGGASVALLGGAGAKGGTAVAAAIVALGTGIAIDRGRHDDSGLRESVAHAASSPDGSRERAGTGSQTERPVSEEGTTNITSRDDSGESGSGSSSGESGSGGDSGGGDPQSPAAAHEDRAEGSSGGSEGSGSGDDSDSGSSGPGGGGSGAKPPPPPPDDDDDGGHSGPGGGGESGDEPGAYEAPEDDGGHSGPGGGGEESAEEPEPPEEPEPLEPPEPPDGSGSSGSGSGHSGESDYPAESG